MIGLTKNELYIFNTLVHQIYSCSENKTMRKQLMSKLSHFLSFDAASFYLSSYSDDQKLCSPVLYNLDKKFGETYLSQYETLDYSKGLMFTGRSMVYRESDIIPDEKRVRTDYYQLFYAPYSFHDSLHLSIAHQERFLGILSLFQKKEKGQYRHEDIEKLGLLTSHLETRLYQDLKRESKHSNKLSLREATETFHLTKRESKVVRYLLDGLESDEICEKMFITNNTLKKHILNVYRKLGINNRVQIFKMIRERE